jgi:hypothetical protein
LAPQHRTVASVINAQACDLPAVSAVARAGQAALFGCAAAAKRPPMIHAANSTNPGVDSRMRAIVTRENPWRR